MSGLQEVQRTRMRDILLGRWKKVAGGECAAGYPEELEFFQATYLGKRGAGQRFIMWDAGGYEVLDQVVQIQIATDEQVPYRYTLVSDSLTFVDREGCEFQYRRVQ